MSRRPVYINAIERAIAGSRKLPVEDRTRAQQAVGDALINFQRQQEPEFHWRSCADALNVAEALADEGIASDADSRGRIHDAQEVLSQVWMRHAAGGSWTMRGREIAALDDGLFIHRVQLDHCSMREYERAIESVRRKTQQALAGNAGPGTVVFGAIR